jgi:hypothetical protein
MSVFNFTGADGASFSIKGEGITEAQARAIFDQQAAAGSLVGLKPGQGISAATQALGGLTSAQSQVAQGLASGITAKLPGIDSIKQLQGLTSGLPVTNGVNVGDIARQATALTGIDQASVTDVRGAMSQAAKLTGQPANQISNSLGVGKFGFEVPQLELAGYVKPGTAEKYLASGTNTVTDVLKSPTVWTGKDNINNSAGFLDNVSKQDLVQTGLMVAGVAGLKSNGVATQILGGAALAGSALVAAKGVEGALDWIQGKLPGADSVNLSQLARDGQFGADFASNKLSDAMTQQFPALPAIDTVDRATLNAASTRVLGNPKIPDVNFSVPASPPADKLLEEFAAILEDFNRFAEEAGILQGRIARTPLPEFLNEQYDNLLAGGRILGNLDVIKGRLLSLKRQAEAKDPPVTSIISQIEAVPIDSLISQLESALDKLEEKVNAASQE